MSNCEENLICANCGLRDAEIGELCRKCWQELEGEQDGRTE
jgi:ribosomal protein L40E